MPASINSTKERPPKFRRLNRILPRIGLALTRACALAAKLRR